MEAFKTDVIIRIKNDQGKYLIAQQDETYVSKSRDGSTKNAQWSVEVNDEESLYLRSCYGKYLTASNQPSIPGMIARNLRVIQTQPPKKNTSHLWLPVSQSQTQPDSREPHPVWLKTLHGSYLRSHHGPPPLGKLITHDLLLHKEGPNPQYKKILWHIEIVDSPSDQMKHSESVVHKMLFGVKTFVSERHKEKEKNKGSKDGKETIKTRVHKNIISRKFNCKMP